MFGKNKIKYGNRKLTHAGRSFDSKTENALFNWLRIREDGKGIRNLEHHPGSIYLSAAAIAYQPDFSYEELRDEGEWVKVWAEYKGFETPVWRIKRRLWISYGPGYLYVFKGSATNLKVHEILIPEDV